MLLEEGINDDLLGHLNSIVEQNQATLSVENKLEVSGRLSVGGCAGGEWAAECGWVCWM